MLTNQLHTESLSVEERKSLGKMILNLFDKWKVSNTNRLKLLSLSPNSKSALYKYKEGKTPLPVSQDTLDRVSMLLSIHKSLRMLYPNNPTICYSWINRQNMLFEKKSPLEIMLIHGFVGVLKIYWYLQRTRRI